MTDLKYQILCFVHDLPAVESLSRVDLINRFAANGVSPVQVSAAVEELISCRYLSCDFSLNDLRVSSPAGILALEAEQDLRRQQQIAQQQADTQLRKEAEQQAARENDRKRDRNIMLLAAGIGAAGAILGGILTSVVEYLLRLRFGG